MIIGYREFFHIAGQISLEEAVDNKVKQNSRRMPNATIDLVQKSDTGSLLFSRRARLQVADFHRRGGIFK